MSNHRGLALAAGTLLIVATTISVIGSNVVSPMLGAPDYLNRLAANENAVILSGILSFLTAATSLGIAVALYPVLREHDEGLAIGSVCFRLIEAVFYTIGALCLLGALTVGKHAAGTAGPDAASYQRIGDLLIAVRDLADFVFAVFAFGVGALLYYIVLLKTRLIPRWLSLWGIAALAGLISAVFLTLADGEPYSLSGGLMVLAIPIAIQEFAMAFWLLIKGFNPAAAGPGVRHGRAGLRASDAVTIA